MKMRSLVMGGVLLAMAFGGAIAVSQNLKRARFGGEFVSGRMLGFFADYLDLTDAQQIQAKEILAKEKPAIQPLLQQRLQAEKQLRELAMSASFDETRVRDMASQQAQIMTELTVQRVRVESELFQLLTPEQKTKLNQFLEKHEQRIGRHFADN